MNEVTQTKTTMRQLLARWAEVEPTLCRLSTIEPKNFELLADPKGRWWTIITEDSLMWIQWAVQQAIVARGWRLESRYGSSIDSASYAWHFWINKYEGYADSANPAEALLSAYLKALEATK